MKLIPYDAVEGYENARLPQKYDAAKRALQTCESIDECKDWKDKAEALRSYARQANDTELYDVALKIQNRARVRMGELYRQIEKVSGGDQRSEKSKSGAPPISKKLAAIRGTGVSQDQMEDAARMSRVPEALREEMIESGATATEIAEEGRNWDEKGNRVTRKFKCVGCGKRVPEGHNCRPPFFEEATKLMGDLSRLSEFLGSVSPNDIAGAMSNSEVNKAKEQAAVVASWLRKFISSTARRKKQR